MARDGGETGIPAVGLHKTTAATLVDGDRDEIRLTTAGRVLVEATSSGAVDTELPAAAALADAAANPTTPIVGAAALGYNGTTWDRLRSDTTNGLDVDVTRLSALVAGSAKIGAVDLDSDATIAAAVPTVAQFVAGTDGTNARALKTDTSGELQVDVLTMPTTNVRKLAPTQKTFVFTFNVVAAAGTAVEILGPTSGSSEILEVYITKPSAATTITINKRSAASTGGTQGTAPTIVPHDATFAAATSVVRVFTADPTEGTLVGEMFRDAMGTGDRVAFSTGDSIGAPITLNADTQVVTIETSAAVTLVGRVVFTERA